MKKHIAEALTTFVLNVEAIATAVFIIFILCVTTQSPLPAVAGLVIGLTLVMIHLAAMMASGISAIPVRSIGSPLCAGPQALSQLWLFIVATSLGYVLGGFLHKARVTAP